MDYIGSAKDCYDEYKDADEAVLQAAAFLCTPSSPCDISESTAEEIELINFVNEVLLVFETVSLVKPTIHSSSSRRFPQ